MGFIVIKKFVLKNEVFEVWVRDEFESTEGMEGWIEIRIADREKYGIYRLFEFLLNGPELIMWFNHQVQGQLFTRAFIDRCFDEIHDYLEEKWGRINSQEIIGMPLKEEYPETNDYVKAFQMIEERLAEPSRIEILF